MGSRRLWNGNVNNREKGDFQMNPRDHLERKSDNNTRADVGGRGQKSDRLRADSWFQRRLVHVRNELKKEILTKSDRLIKNH